jgi:hypothetical protein
VDENDIGMLNLREALSFLECVISGRVVVSLRQQLERDLPVEVLVPCTEDFAVGAVTDPLEEAEVAPTRRKSFGRIGALLLVRRGGRPV